MPSSRPAALRGDESRLFAELDERVGVLLRHRIQAPEALLEDARAFAWEQLMRHQPERSEALIAWLLVVAKHEAFRLLGRSAREVPPPAVVVDPDHPDADPFAQFVDERDLDERLEAHDALRALAAIPARNREALALKVAGHSYGELQEILGVSYTCVNRLLSEGRAHLRAHKAT